MSTFCHSGETFKDPFCTIAIVEWRQVLPNINYSRPAAGRCPHPPLPSVPKPARPSCTPGPVGVRPCEPNLVERPPARPTTIRHYLRSPLAGLSHVDDRASTTNEDVDVTAAHPNLSPSNNHLSDLPHITRP